MVRPSIQQLRQFYSSALGQMAKSALMKTIRGRWPELNGDLTLGIGYATPFLRAYLREEPADDLLLAPVMPAGQGAIAWPQPNQTRSLLAYEHQLPFANNIANRLLLVHTLEYATDPQQLVEECWRLLSPGGHMLVVVPNRHGLWASSSHTPFSYGHPYSVAQLKHLLCPPDRFTVVDVTHTLFFAPNPHGFWRRLAPLMGWIGRMIFSHFGGVVVMEVEKQIYAGIKEPVRKLVPQPVYAPLGGKPAMNKDR